MLGRPLGHGLNLRRNLRVLREWEQFLGSKKTHRLFASFGSVVRPPARNRRSPLPADYNYYGEATLLSRFSGQVHHPNEKRAQVVKILREMNSPLVDARLWRSKDPALYAPPLTEAEYRIHTSRSSAVVNISGLRRSIPYRMADTLLTGGLLATDELAVRWYQPFEPFEVRELGPMGYELAEDVNWQRVEETFRELAAEEVTPEIQKARTNAYETKWSPIPFATYFMEQCESTLAAAK
jgi:hypothetical protein